MMMMMKKEEEKEEKLLWRHNVASVLLVFLCLVMVQHYSSTLPTSSSLFVVAAAATTHSPSHLSPQQNRLHDGDMSHTDKEPLNNTIKVHAWIMYISTGILLPLGVLVARFMKNSRNNNKDDQRSARIVNILYYTHLTLQTTGIVVLTGGAIYSFRNFGYEFKHAHQKLGICLWCILWLQPIIGILKPAYGGRLRPVWYGIHWLFGIGSITVSILNIYMGMDFLESRTNKSIHNFKTGLSIQIAFMAIAYLAQDRWGYMLQQGRRNVTTSISPRTPLQSTILLSPVSYSMVPSTSRNYQMRHYLPS